MILRKHKGSWSYSTKLNLREEKEYKKDSNMAKLCRYLFPSYKDIL